MTRKQLVAHIHLCFCSLAIIMCAPAKKPSTTTQPTPVSTPPKPTPTVSFRYPNARRDATVDTYHGVQVADPYRWLEDPDSAETRAWIEAQTKLTSQYLSTIPERDRIKTRLTELWDFEKFGVPFKKAKRTFFTRNTGLQNQNVLYWTETLDGEPKVLIDPNTLSTDGTVALAGTVISDDGTYLAYGIQTAGSDWAEWKVRNVTTGQDLPDRLKWIKFSEPAWTKDNKGFYYSRYPEPKAGSALAEANVNQKLYYHRLGTPQSKDKLIYERPEHKEWGFGPQISDDGRYLIVTIWKGTGDQYRVYYQDLRRKQRTLTPLIDEFKHKYAFVGNRESTFWFHTDDQASRGKLIAIDLKHPEPSSWKEIVAETPNTLESISLVGNHFVGSYLKHAATEVVVYNLEGKPVRTVDLPGIGTAYGFEGEPNDPETFFGYTSFSTPTIVYRYDVQSGSTVEFRKPNIKFDPTHYQTEQVFYRSKDGTQIPMFLTYKKGLQRDGNRPTLLYGYGGFNISLTPSFDVRMLVWMEMGGVYAVANLRGGGEYGETWHQAGTKLNKQHVFDDFIAAAEWLIKNRFTSSSKLAIHGRSNGGLLVGAVSNQRPDLFAAAIPGVGVMDMLRFHKFTIGWAWIDDYGSSDDPAQFRALYAYSPYHRIEAKAYPATLVTTADHDDRVVPGHSFKYAAELQRSHTGSKPILIRIETRAGHGAGKPTTKRIEEAADWWAFLVRELKISTEP